MGFYHIPEVFPSGSRVAKSKTSTHLLILEQILPRASLHKVRKRVGVLQRVATLGQQGGRIEQILPVDPRAESLHDLLVDTRLHPVQRLLLQLQRLGVVLPAFVVVEVLFQRFPGLTKRREDSYVFRSIVQQLYTAYLRVHRLVGNVRVFLVPRALVILGTVRLPVPQAHPAKVVLAVEALHVIAAAVLLDADVTLGTVLGVGADVVGRFAVVGALCEPLADDLAIGGRVIVHPAPEAERRRAHLARRLLRADVRAADDDLLSMWEEREREIKC